MSVLVAALVVMAQPTPEQAPRAGLDDDQTHYGQRLPRPDLGPVPVPIDEVSNTSDEQGDELLRLDIAPGSWASALSNFIGATVDRRAVRAIACVGLVATDMSCGWQRRLRGRWRDYTGWADLSRETGPQIRIATPAPPGAR